MRPLHDKSEAPVDSILRLVDMVVTASITVLVVVIVGTAWLGA